MADPKERPEDETEDDVELETEADGPDDVEDDGADGDEKTGEDAEGDESEEGEEDDGDEPDELQVQPEELRGLKPNTRAYDRVQSALARAKAAEQERDAARAESSTRTSAEAAAAHAQRVAEREKLLAGMSEDQRTLYIMAEQIKITQDGLKQLDARNADNADRATFQARYSNHPRYGKLAAEAEKRHAEMVKSGAYAPREAVLDYLIGNQVRLKGDQAGKQQKRKAAKRIDRERGRAGNARSDVRGGRERGSLLSRMERDDPQI